MLLITEHDYKHAKIGWNAYNIEDIDFYYDLYVQSDTLL